VKRVYYAAFCSLLVIIFLFFQGCGDTNVFDGMSDDGGEAARTEQAKQDLNSGNFDTVIAALGTRSNLTEQETRYLASAYMGKAGFDTLKLLEESAREDDTSTFDVITHIFDEDGDGEITFDQLNTKIHLIDQALGVLGDSGQGGNARFSRALVNFSRALVNSSPSDDVKLQRGICAAIHATFTICRIVDCEYALHQGGKLIPLTVNALQALKNAQPGKIIVLTYNGRPDLGTYLADLNNDLGWMQQAVEALNGGNLDQNLGQTQYQEENENDIQREFNDFLVDIGYTGSEPEVTANELELYLNGSLK
jgi:hypothetical protein